MDYSKSSPSKEGMNVAQDITWSDVCFKIGEKDILKGCWGIAKAKQITGLMGPSGSGKTSLLNLLSGRVSELRLQTT
jgi:ABC-type multidrug transport system ATPase subunit